MLSPAAGSWWLLSVVACVLWSCCGGTPRLLTLARDLLHPATPPQPLLGLQALVTAHLSLPAPKLMSPVQHPLPWENLGEGLGPPAYLQLTLPQPFSFWAAPSSPLGTLVFQACLLRNALYSPGFRPSLMLYPLPRKPSTVSTWILLDS